MAKFNPGIISLPAGMTIGQALSLGLLNYNVVVLSGYNVVGGVVAAQGGVSSVHGNPYYTNNPQPQLAGQPLTGGGDVAGQTPDVNPGPSGLANANPAFSTGNNTIGQLMATSSVQLSSLCSNFVFATYAGGD
jgi:hypothetical protein